MQLRKSKNVNNNRIAVAITKVGISRMMEQNEKEWRIIIIEALAGRDRQIAD
jgi:hypothetical protein